MFGPQGGAAGSRPGSHAGLNITLRAVSRQSAAGSSWYEESPPPSRQAKLEKIEALYNFPEAIKSREALRDKVLAGSPNRGKRAEPQEAKSEVIQEWLRNERKEADKVAEELWRGKFVEWHTKLRRKENDKGDADDQRLSMPGSPCSDTEAMQSFSDDPDLAALRQKTETYTEDVHKLSDMQGKLESEVVRIRDELEAERQRRANMEKTLQTAIEDRDAWSSSAQRHELMRKRLLREQQETNAQVAEMQSQIGAISSTLMVDEAKSS